MAESEPHRIISQEASGDIIKTAFTQYIDRIKPLSVVSEVIVTTSPDGPDNHVFNVTDEDFSRNHLNDMRYQDVRRFAGMFEDSLHGIVAVHVSSVNPSQLHEFLEDCSTRGYNVRRIPIEKPSSSVI